MLELNNFYVKLEMGAISKCNNLGFLSLRNGRAIDGFGKIPRNQLI